MTIAIVVEIDMTAGQEDAFRKRVQLHRDTVLANEPGCRAFEVMIPREHPEKVFLYEVYDDAAALDHHLSSPHMRLYREQSAALVAQRRIIVCDPTGG